MLSTLVGQVDVNAAFVLVALVAAFALISTSLIVKRRSKTEVSNEFELAKIKQEAENSRAMYQVETDRAYKFKQIEEKLITSHQRVEE